MTFANPWMLFALALCAIPAILHWRRRRPDYEPVDWGATRFLRTALEQTAHRRRVESWLPLILRTLLIALLVLAAAGPRFSRLPDRQHLPAGTETILVLDASASMSEEAGGQSSYQRAIDVIHQILDRADPEESWTLIRIAAPAGERPIRGSTDRDAIRRALADRDVTEARGDLPETLRSVIQRLEQSGRPDTGHPLEVLVLSDFQDNVWYPERFEEQDRLRERLKTLSERASLRLVNVGRSLFDNLALTDLTASPPILSPGQPVTLTARIRNISERVATARVEWRVNGRIENVVPLEVAPRVQQLATFRTQASDSSPLEVEARLLVDDALRFDNRRFCVVPIRESLRMLLVDGRGGGARHDRATGFLELALDSSESDDHPAGVAFEPVVIPEGAFAATDLKPFDGVWLCDVPRVSPEDVARLARFVADGGGLVISMGDQVDLAQYRDVFADVAPDLLPVELWETWSLPPTHRLVTFRIHDNRHPLVRRFVTPFGSGLTTTTFSRYVRAGIPPTGESRVALQFSTNEPAIVDRSSGLGRVVMVLTSVDDRWGNFAVWPTFLPLMQETALLATSGKWQPWSRTIGTPLTLPLRANVSGDEEVHLTLPHGEKVSLVPQCENGICRVEWPDTRTAGIYRLSSLPSADVLPHDTLFVVVNPDTDESDTRPWGLNDFTPRMWRGIAFESYEAVTHTDLSNLFQKRRFSVTNWLLWGAVLLMLLEGLTAWNPAVGWTATRVLGGCLVVWWGAQWLLPTG